MLEIIKMVILACQIQHVDSSARHVNNLQKYCQVEITACLIKKNNMLTESARSRSLLKCMAERK